MLCVKVFKCQAGYSDPRRPGGTVRASVTRARCRHWHLIKAIKYSLILAHDATDLISDHLVVDLTGRVRKIAPAGRSWGGGQPKDQPLPLSFLSPWSGPSFFTAAQMGSHFLFPVVWMGCLETTGNCSIGRDFFFSTVVWKVRGSAHGWYVFHIHIIIYETTVLSFVVFQHLNLKCMTTNNFECNYCPCKHNDLNLVSTMI